MPADESNREEEKIMQKALVMALIVLFCSFPAMAREVAGINMEDEVTQEDGTVLLLNGVGVRSKFFFKIYAAGLYLESKSSTTEEILAQDGGKRVVMHFLYSEVGRDDLVEAWNAGFTANGTAEQLASLAEEIAAFNQLFDTVKEGDRIVLDYRPGTGTSVTVRDEVKGVVAGKPFNDLLLSIWLGKEPVAEDLRAGLLGS
jgi:hypothetical protein